LNLRPRLVVIFLQYDTEKYADAFEHLRSHLSRVDPERVAYILVNNKDEGNRSSNLGRKTVLLQGDNTEREFSGFQKGLDFVRENRLEYDVILFVNDSFEVHGPSYLSNHNISWLILKAYLVRAVLGLVATRWDKARIKGKTITKWLGTDCFFVPKVIVDKLGSLVSVDKISIGEYLPESFPGPDDVFMATAPINSVYRESIINWLTERWHSKFAIEESSWTLFRSKVKAILNEVMLYVRIRELGYMILPYDIPLFAFTKIRGAFRRGKKVFLQRENHAPPDSIFNGQ